MLRFPRSLLWDLGSCIHPLASHLYQDIPQSPQTQPTLPELCLSVYIYPSLGFSYLSQYEGAPIHLLTQTNTLPHRPPNLVSYQVRLVNFTPKPLDHHLGGQPAITSHGIGVAVSSLVSISLLLSSSNTVRSIFSNKQI